MMTITKWIEELEALKREEEEDRAKLAALKEEVDNWLAEIEERRKIYD